MASKIELLKEAHKRGLLKGEKLEMYNEAVKRGLIVPNDTVDSTNEYSLSDEQRKNAESRLEQLKAAQVGYSEREKEVFEPSALRAGVEGAIAGFTQPALGAARMAGLPVGEEIDVINQRQQELQKDQALANIGGQIAGNIAATIPTGGAAVAGAKALGGGIKAASLAGGAAGATEAGLISAGQGESPLNVGLSALGGGVIGAAMPSLISGIKSLGQKLFQKVTGKTVGNAAKLIDEAGKPTAEMQKVLDKAGMSYDDLVRVAQSQQEEIAKAASKGDLSGVAGKADIDKGLAEAAQRSGIEATPATLSANKAFQEVEAAVGSLQGTKTGELIRKEADSVKDSLEKMFIEKTKGGDLSTISDEIKSTLSNKVDVIYGAENDLYNEIGKSVNKAEKVDAKTILKKAIDEMKSGMSNDELKDARPFIYDLDSFFKRSDYNPSYQYLDQKRKQIGEAMGKGSGRLSGESYGELKALYGTISDQLDYHLQRNYKGTNIPDLVKQAKEVSKSRFAILDAVKDGFGKDLNEAMFEQKLSQSLVNLTKNKPDDFIKTMNAVPKDLRNDALMLALENRLIKKGQFSINDFNSFMSDINKSEKARSALQKTVSKEAYQGLQDRYKVIQQMQSKAKQLYTGKYKDIEDFLKGTAPKINKLIGEGARMATAGAGAGVGGGYGAWVGWLIGGGVKKAVSKGEQNAIKNIDNLMSNPNLINTALNLTAGNKQAAQKAADSLVKSTAYKTWLKQQPQSVKQQIARQGLISYMESE